MNKLESLKVLQEEVQNCTKCDLAKTRKNTVFSRGNPESRLCFMGEAPGENEDLTGRPFVGRAGLLLDAMIMAMGLTPNDIYICNIIKCRPPGNRRPLPEEVAACYPFREKQLQLVRPQVIVALGATAAEGLLGPGPNISKRRGKWHSANGVAIMPTFHPSYLLRNPAAKETVKEDLKLVLDFLKEVEKKDE